MFKRTTIEGHREKYYKHHPELVGLIEIIEQESRGRKAFVCLKEVSTGRTKWLVFDSLIRSQRRGIPIEFSCHPESIESFTSKYFALRPHLRGIIEIIDKKSINKSTYIRLLEIKTEKKEWVSWANAKALRTCGIPKDFSCHPQSIENLSKEYFAFRPKMVGLIKMIDKKWGNVKFEEIKTKRKEWIKWEQCMSPLSVGVPVEFECYDSEKKLPLNTKKCTVYLAKTQTYGEYDKWSNGPYITTGITVHNAKARYYKNSLMKVYFEIETLNCREHEKNILNTFKDLLGKPDAGREAWKWSIEKERALINAFKQYWATKNEIHQHGYS